MQKSIEVCLTPALLDLYAIEDSIVVVIDVLRATSSIVYGIDNGATAIIPVANVEDCLNYSDKGFLLAAERDGQVVEGYDFGNSPFSYTTEKVGGRTVVLTTTNGTKALHMARKRAHQVVMGSFLNLQALCNHLKPVEKITKITALMARAGLMSVNKDMEEKAAFCNVLIEPKGMGEISTFDMKKAETIYWLAYEETLKTIKSNESLKNLIKVPIKELE
jgi:phosphosulfolactate phosphohydrolase-like enzyme